MTGAIPSHAYHSAHKPPVASRPVDRHADSRCVAFVHDITTGALPADYQACDVLVTDLPWQRGFGTFNTRAGIDDGRTYRQFIRAVGDVVTAAAVPTWLVTGDHARRSLPHADVAVPLDLNGDAAIAYGYRPGLELETRHGSAQELLRTLATLYTVAGDPCCGYGRTARVFLAAGKRAVVSDINPLCIGHIADHAPGWAR